jgi:hypothetical protein
LTQTDVSRPPEKARTTLSFVMANASNFKLNLYFLVVRGCLAFLE